MKRLLQILFQPYPIELSWKVHLRHATLSFLFVMLFLFFFRPFEMKIPEDYELTFFLICAYFGAVTWVVYLFFHTFRFFFPAIFAEGRWQVWKEIMATLVLVFLIATANMLFSNYYFDQPSLWQFFGGWLKTTFAIGIFPIIFTAFYKQIRLSNRYQTESQIISQQIEEHTPHSPVTMNTAQVVTLLGENQNEKLEIGINHLLYLASADNYVEIFYLEDTRLKQVLFRASLKKMEESLANTATFYRCHRAYIVNLQKVKSISGNAQGYKLHLENTDTLIPVSRSLNGEIAQKFAKK